MDLARIKGSISRKVVGVPFRYQPIYWSGFAGDVPDVSGGNDADDCGVHSGSGPGHRDRTLAGVIATRISTDQILNSTVAGLLFEVKRTYFLFGSWPSFVLAPVRKSACRWFDSAPGHHSYFFETQRVSGVTRGLSGRAGPKIGRPSDLYGRRPFWQVSSS